MYIINKRYQKEQQKKRERALFYFEERERLFFKRSGCSPLLETGCESTTFCSSNEIKY